MDEGKLFILGNRLNRLVLGGGGGRMMAGCEMKCLSLRASFELQIVAHTTMKIRLSMKYKLPCGIE